MTNAEQALEKLASKGELGAKLKKGYDAVKSHVKTNSKKYSALGGAAAGAAAAKVMQKSASELSHELAEEILKEASYTPGGSFKQDPLGGAASRKEKVKNAIKAILGEAKKHKGKLGAAAGAGALLGAGGTMLAKKASGEDTTMTEILSDSIEKLAAGGKVGAVVESVKGLGKNVGDKAKALYEAHPKKVIAGGAAATGLGLGALGTKLLGKKE
jgi:hypothetical protein